MNKYNAKKTIVDGIEFASKREANRYFELKLLQRAGEIKNLQLQVKYELQPGYELKDKKIRPIYYIADFVYTRNGQVVVEDTKGFRTKEYQLKKKLFEYKYKIKIEEV